jgi:two-component system phosphate regulon sensor histidine kinase PhoR
VKKKLRLTFVIAALAAFSIISFQMYWVYSNYVNAQRSFTVTAINSLEKSIQAYQLQSIDLPSSLNYKVPSLTVFMRTKPDNYQAMVFADRPKQTKSFDAVFTTFAVDKHNMSVVRALIARLMIQQLNKPINLDTLTVLFKKELLKNQIAAPFTLTIRRNLAVILPGEIAARIDFEKSPIVLKAKIDNQAWLLRHNLMPSLLSLLLVLLSAGSLWYMGIVIRRQLKLDRLKNEFISNITHELRTPMTILRSSNEAIAQFGIASDPEKLARYTGINFSILDKLENEVERILDIIQLEKRQDSTVRKAIDLEQIAQEVILRFSIMGHTRLKLDCRQDGAPVFSDPQKIDSILSNLIDNALKYSGLDASVLVQIQVNKNNWHLTVCDDGRGISLEDQPYLFDKFYRVNTGDLHDVKGYGLGLSYVKGLVESMGGKIRLKSKPGHGAAFIINVDRNEQD